jgi:aspartyl-tRNA(Asn)/glutamyl-tRNA(Gln) amidotransferase subunit C
MAPRIALADVEHVARLARLALTADEKERMREQLDRILAYIDKLRQLDTEDVEPTSHAVPMVNVMRDDEVEPGLPAEEMLANAPDRAGAFFRVPRIIEDEP